MTDKPNFQIQLPEPWHWIEMDFETELYRELPHGHILKGKTFKTIARRQDMDDFLFVIDNCEFEYAIVHLTWAKETNEKWPITSLYKSWKEVYEKRILPDSIKFE
jgi:hypothetical protein